MIQQGTPETIVGASLKVEGILKSEGDLRIDGEVKGTITTQGTVSVGEHAVIEADIVAGAAVIAGDIKGNLNITGKTSLKKTANLKGNINTQQIEIEAGAGLIGKCNTGSTKKNTSPGRRRDNNLPSHSQIDARPTVIAENIPQDKKESVSV